MDTKLKYSDPYMYKVASRLQLEDYIWAPYVWCYTDMSITWFSSKNDELFWLETLDKNRQAQKWPVSYPRMFNSSRKKSPHLWHPGGCYNKEKKSHGMVLTETLTVWLPAPPRGLFICLDAVGWSLTEIIDLLYFTNHPFLATSSHG